jgi:hypothetical protein
LPLALPTNSKTQLERVSKGKPSSLLGLVISDKRKKFYNIGTWTSKVNQKDKCCTKCPPSPWTHFS